MSWSYTTVKSAGIYILILCSLVYQFSCTVSGTAVPKLINRKLCNDKAFIPHCFNSFINKTKLRECLEHKYINTKFFECVNDINILILYIFFIKHILTRYRTYICCNKNPHPLACFPCYLHGASYIVSYIIYILSKTYCITCKCIRSYNLCTGLNVCPVNSKNPVWCRYIGHLRKASFIIYLRIICTKCTISINS